MARQDKEKKNRIFRITLVDDETHKPLWSAHFSRMSLMVAAVTVFITIFLLCYAITAFTPVRTLIPGYPDAHAKRAAVQNAIKIDSLERAMSKWYFYSENLRRVLEGTSPLKVDSLISGSGTVTAQENTYPDSRKSDSLLRANVTEEEQFELSISRQRNLHIEGMHFFCPLKGVVSQPYDPFIHPYIDITAPSNSVVYSVLDGTVISSGWSDEYGYSIQIQHTNNIISIYRHNQKLLKKTGDKVSAGAPIAIVGNTGTLSTGDHLHFELWYKGETVDPAKYINF